MLRISVWTDGSCLTNSGINATSGIGVYYGNNDPRNYSSALKAAKVTNNKAELVAILYALVMDFNEHHMSIHTDSMYSIKCISEYALKWEHNGWVTSKGTPVESSPVIKYILHLIRLRDINRLETQFVHVKGHSTDLGNNAADLLARNGALSGIEGGRLQMLRYCKVPI